MADGNVNVSGGVGLPGLVFIVFLILKLCGVIAWSWWWVTAPLWIPLALGLIFLVIVGIIVGIAAALK